MRRYPRHYWKTGVEFCEAQVSTPPDKWLGYGSRTLSNCQSAQDATHIYPRFYQFGADPGCTNPDLTVCPVFRAPSPAFLDNYTTPAFRRTDLTAASAPFVHSWVDDDGAQTISRSYAEEMTNYANWFRVLSNTHPGGQDGDLGRRFPEIDAKYRVGFHAMFLPQRSSTSRTSTARCRSLPGSPKIVRRDHSARPGDAYPGCGGAHRRVFPEPRGTRTLSGATDPIQLSCQQNFHMLFTDGITNQSPPPTTIGNMDGVTVPTTVNMVYDRLA
mgnify:CR=1 FL=1